MIKVKSRVARTSIALGLVLAVSLGVVLIKRGPTAPADFLPGTTGREVSVDIANGATGSDIARILFKLGVVKSSLVFFNLAVVDSRSSQIAPGMHRIATHIPAEIALNQLLDPKRIENLIQVPEGAWTSEILKLMAQRGFTMSELTRALSEVVPPKGFSGTEGFFFPAQYSFAKGTSALTALQAMTNRFSTEAQSSGLSKGTSEFTPMQLLTIASLVQAEGEGKDFSKISQVVRNRLRLGMPLQFDSTIHYIRGTRGQVYLSTDATKTPSEYNTYLHYGLPPTPINNPGRAAMEAAVTPTSGSWIYFITVKPGDTRFTDSNAEFSTWKNEYEQNLRAGAFKAKK